jgi:hypothetical protein
MKGNNILYLLFLVGCLSSCDSSLSPKEYMRWVNSKESGLHKRKEVGEYVFDIQHKPFVYLKIQEYGKNIRQDSLIKWQKEEQAQTMQYYDLHIEVKGGKTDILKYHTANEQVYNDKLYYFSYQFQQDIYIEAGV